MKKVVSLTSGFLKKGKSAEYLKVRKSRATVSGRLTLPGGQGVQNATLAVIEKFATGSRRAERTSYVQTDSTGQYLKVLGKGPNRTVQVNFGGSSTLARQAGRELRIEAFDKTSLKIRPKTIRNGGTVKMVGRIVGQGGIAPSGGKLVAIQFFDPSRAKWRPVDVIRTSGRGRFTYTYRFRTITSAQRIIFRAASLPEVGWPFLPSTSASRSVIVYPRTGS